MRLLLIGILLGFPLLEAVVMVRLAETMGWWVLAWVVLAACANVLAPATSFYRWEGRDEQAVEFPVLIKSTRERYPALEQAIRARHPYELPEIIAWGVDAGLPAYLEWVEREVAS